MRETDGYNMLRNDLRHIVTELHAPHAASLWDCEEEPCKSALLPALNIGGPAWLLLIHLYRKHKEVVSREK